MKKNKVVHHLEGFPSTTGSMYTSSTVWEPLYWQAVVIAEVVIGEFYSKQTLALQQASEELACFLLSFFCDD